MTGLDSCGKSFATVHSMTQWQISEIVLANEFERVRASELLF